MSRQIIALCGPAGSGKTTLARLLTDQGFKRFRFADPMKSMIVALLFAQGLSFEDAKEMVDGDLKEVPTPFLEYRSPRHAMQTLGTEWRELIGRNLWVNAWERAIEREEKVVVDDMRFTHEAERVRFLNGTIVRIERPGFGPSSHISEQEYISIAPDLIIQNNKDSEDMLRQLIYLLDWVDP